MVTDQEFENNWLNDPRNDMVAQIVKARILKEKQYESKQATMRKDRPGLIQRLCENLYRLIGVKNRSNSEIYAISKKHKQI